MFINFLPIFYYNLTFAFKMLIFENNQENDYNGGPSRLGFSYTSIPQLKISIIFGGCKDNDILLYDHSKSELTQVRKHGLINQLEAKSHLPVNFTQPSIFVLKNIHRKFMRFINKRRSRRTRPILLRFLPPIDSIMEMAKDNHKQMPFFPLETRHNSKKYKPIQ